SQRRGKYRNRCTGIPLTTWSGAPRYEELRTSTTCPAVRSGLSSSTSQGTITSCGERGNAVTTWRMRMEVAQSYDFPGVCGHGIFPTHDQSNRAGVTRAHQVLQRTPRLAQLGRRA